MSQEEYLQYNGIPELRLLGRYFQGDTDDIYDQKYKNKSFVNMSQEEYLQHNGIPELRLLDQYFQGDTDDIYNQKYRNKSVNMVTSTMAQRLIQQELNNLSPEVLARIAEQLLNTFGEEFNTKIIQQLEIPKIAQLDLDAIILREQIKYQ